MSDPRPLIAHVVHRFAVGGMENGVVNLINRLPPDFARHCVVALTDADPTFTRRIVRADTPVLAMNRPAGQLAWFLPTLTRAFRRLGPDVVHTRNVGTLESQVAAWAAGVPVRIHGEHGWDVGDLNGTNRRMLWLRRLMRPFVQHQIALSEPTHRYLVDRVGVRDGDVTSICNGVDVQRFAPAADRAAGRAELAAVAGGTLPPGHAPAFLVGAVGRLARVKNLPLLVEAVAELRARSPEFAARARLVLVGDGPEDGALRALVSARGLADATWIAGARDDIPRWLQALDVLCLPSLAEGISNTILEAMACGVPVVATDVGGNRELVADGETGRLVPSGDLAALARAIECYSVDEVGRACHAAAARKRAVTEFSLDTMVSKYHRVYETQLIRAGRHVPPAGGVATPTAHA